MKKIYVSLLILGAGVSTSFANTISEAQAVDIAAEFQSANTNLATRSGGELSASKYGDFFYIVNNSNGGWVIVSADDRLPDMVLGYSDKGSLDSAAMPQSIRNIIDGYAYGISRIDEKGGVSLKPVTRSAESVAPLLGELTWHQSHPFNNLFPIIEIYQDNANAGCVQIAQGMLMHHYKYPDRGKGSNSFQLDGKFYSMDFSKSVYQWDLMKPIYTGDDSQESIDAVAKLIYDLAIANEADFNSLSAASLNVDGIVKNFDYDPSIYMVQTSLCTRQYYEDLMRASVSEGIPVYIQGRNEMNGGHAFLCDGYDGNGLFHYNLGGDDGYFLSNATGYDAEQYIYPNIRPNHGGSPRIWAASDKELLWDSDNTIICHVRAMPIIDNPKGTTDVAIALEDKDGMVTYYPQYHSNSLSVIVENFDFEDNVPDGEYTLYPVYRMNEGEWIKICFPENAADHINLSVSKGRKTYTNTSTGGVIDDSTVLVDGIYYKVLDNEAIVTYRNNLYNSYSGDVAIPEEVTIQGVVYPVTAIGDNAFQGSTLGKVYIGSNVAKIGQSAFANTEIGRLEYANDENITELGERVFVFCHIDELKIPAGVTSLRYLTTLGGCKALYLPTSIDFMDVWCIANEEKMLKDIYVYWNNPAELPEAAFDGIGYGPFNNVNRDFAGVTLHVPEGCIDMYKNDNVWSIFGSYVEGNAGVDSIIGGDSDISISAGFDGIILNSLPAGQTAYIYNMQGMLIGQGRAGDTVKAGKGIFIVKVGNTVKKIIL